VRYRSHILVGGVIALIALASVPTEAQRRHHGRGHVTVIRHSPLLWGGGYFSGFYHPYYAGFGPWYPYPGFGFPTGVYHQDPVVSLRLQVNPREASVFVDGYAAGVVDDFDGVFQRLRLIPGPHEIVIYHPGYRTLRQSVYFNPGSTHTIRETLDQLAPGEPHEPHPVPRPLTQRPAMPPAGAAPDGVHPSFAPGAPAGKQGTLVLRVQPADATVLVDGEPWKGPASQDRLVVQLGEGPHRVRVEKAGFQTFSVDVDVRAGETTSFNVSLLSK
jgi:hypothetical protein